MTIVETADRNLWTEVEEWVKPQLPVGTSVQGFSIYAQTDTGWVERFKLPLGKSGLLKPMRGPHTPVPPDRPKLL